MRELNDPSTSSGTARGDGANATPGSVMLKESVITEDLLAKHGAAGRTVHISTAAVVTPSGRDYVRRHQVMLQVASDSSATAADTGHIFVVGDAHGISTAATSAGWAVSPASGNFDAANQVAQTSITKRSVCCSTQPSVIACLVNRNTQHRAAVLTAQTCVIELLREMNPTTICLCPVGWTFAELKRLLQRLGAQGTECPAAWREIV